MTPSLEAKLSPGCEIWGYRGKGPLVGQTVLSQCWLEPRRVADAELGQVASRKVLGTALRGTQSRPSPSGSPKGPSQPTNGYAVSSLAFGLDTGRPLTLLGQVVSSLSRS